MAQFKAFSPEVEVRSEVILSFIEVMGAFRRLADEILRDHGIRDLMPGYWIPQQAWLDSFAAILDKIGPNTLFYLARQIPTSADIQPDIDTLEKALFSLDEAYRMSHRGGEVGHYIFYKTGEQTGRMETKTPYPCDFDRGILDALTRRFEPSNPYLEVRHLDTEPCKKDGSEYCSYAISW